ncbi:Protein CBG17130 [Caenorhabditis briggsae]|uniref:Protein CBG17130 n=1 Tax=Caenorhabditis briggsae TaxID=6238 RepID=A8XQP8_CAEBR|nr:Protein CBG17130 [Caenorhabditis briggsae]CAP34973.2 Protein CBG17130 [Caenorhabditis briggsae]
MDMVHHQILVYNILLSTYPSDTESDAKMKIRLYIHWRKDWTNPECIVKNCNKSFAGFRLLRTHLKKCQVNRNDRMECKNCEKDYGEIVQILPHWTHLLGKLTPQLPDDHLLNEVYFLQLFSGKAKFSLIACLLLINYGRNERGQGRSNYGYSQNGSNSNLQDRGPYRDQGFNDSRNNYGYQTEPPRGQRRDYGNGSTRQPENRIDDRVLAEEAFRMTALGLKRNRRSSSHSSGGRRCSSLQLQPKCLLLSKSSDSSRMDQHGIPNIAQQEALQNFQAGLAMPNQGRGFPNAHQNTMAGAQGIPNRAGLSHQENGVPAAQRNMFATAGAQPPGHNDYPLAPTPPGIPNVGGAPYNAELMAALGYAAERLPNMGPPNGPSADPALIAVLGYGARGERNRPNAAHPHAHIPHGVPNFAANHHLGHRPDHPHRSRNMAPPVGAPADPAFMTARDISLVQKKENGRSTIVFQ